MPLAGTEWLGDNYNPPIIAIRCWCGNGRTEYHEEPRKMYLQYYDLGTERGHVLEGDVIEVFPNGLLFEWKKEHTLFKLVAMSMEDFERRVRSHLSPDVSAKLNTLDDVYGWYRNMAGIT